MTDQVPDTHSTPPATEPLALRLSDGLGITAPEREELARLRQRVKAQRAELRRLNKTLGPYWAGFRSGLHYDSAKDVRIKMFAAFGVPAVQKAEKAPCNCLGHQHGATTGGWWCPLHGHQL